MKIWIVSEVFYPDEDGTAHYMTCLAEDFARFWPVKVICGQPKYSARGKGVPQSDIRHGVQIERATDLALDKNTFLFRVLNVLFLSVSMLLRMFRGIRPGDLAFVVTSPPLMPILALFACKIRKARLVIRVDDVYPEAMVASGVLSKSGFMSKIMIELSGWVFRNADRVVVLGRDMERLVRSRTRAARQHILVIRNWADLETVQPSGNLPNPLLHELGIEDKDVIQCAGNMGRVQAIETMFKAAELLRAEERIHFLFIGNGAKKKWMQREAVEKSLKNITLLDYRARSEQNVFLNACHISMASLISGMAGVGVPSRMYNVMAAGKPLIAVADEESELSMVIEEEGIGWVAPPDDPLKLAAVIKEAFSDRNRLADMGRSARKIAEQKYKPAHVLAAYRTLIEDVMRRPSSAS